MISDRSRDRHLETSQVLDFLEDRLGEPGKRKVEQHLGRPCPACRERVRSLSELLSIMRLDRVGPVPPSLRQRALAQFAPVEGPVPAPTLLEALAELVFDSAGQQLTAAARRSVGEARRLRFAVGKHSLELETEREGAATFSLRGRFITTDPQFWSIVVEVGTECRAVRPDTDGSFTVNGLPRAGLIMHLIGFDERFRLPTIDP